MASGKCPQRLLPTGALAAIPTFFEPSGEGLDLATIRKHVTRLVKAGIVGLVAMGSNGEAPHLNRSERVAVIQETRRALDEAGYSQVSIIVGASESSVRGTLELCREVAQAGGDYALVLPPSYFRGAMSRDVLKDFYIGVADSSPVPILIYSFPAVTAGIELDSDQIISISSHPNVVGTKFTCGDTGKLARVARAMKAITPFDKGPGYVCYGGLLDFGLMALVAGGSGFIAGGANILPVAAVRLCHYFESRQYEKAMALQSLLAEGDWQHTSAGIGGTKHVLQVANGYGGAPRRPLPSIQAEESRPLMSRMEASLRLEADLVKQALVDDSSKAT